ncbi:phenylacetate--CoA ligase family protein [Robiginitalea sp. M366]|uniref:phenylacetate--CoA ligase family protein n=1 Tax=Robiginitalea aestuariiviva TaxID=3036903 RepID=UPI00240CF021|nr:phenylacetate--CoA ligase family protein [Robiginitalea aestuariiviva]MDG1572729.1 phenylacetate--CoA ligase family protein [Robiginitalea aestuariiviva]
MILDKIYRNSPNFLQELMISLYNIKAYNIRYGKNYRRLLKEYSIQHPIKAIEEIQERKFKDLVQYAAKHSPFYQRLFPQDVSGISIEQIGLLPIVNKEQIRQNLTEVYTIAKKKGVLSKTGGTTGKSLEVLYRPVDVEERFAILDNFRKAHGYKLGKRTAWFSGKTLLTPGDLNKYKFWKTDWIYKVRYYSTFHIHPKNLTAYIANLIEYKPEYMVGFPSTMYEIAKFGRLNNLDFPKNTIKAIFPTAETVTSEIRAEIEAYFKTRMYDQYASSEGAPFIFECSKRNLHLELRSGVFEVLDENNQASKSGRLVVTSFTTYGTPLIRYDIGDTITLSDKVCDCGNANPLVEEISGRINDYIYSEEVGKINLGNISNCLKGVKGVLQFQIMQNEVQAIHVNAVVDENIFDDSDQQKFIENLTERVGTKMEIKFKRVDHIPVEKSGKYRLVKNNIHHFLK